MPVQEFVSRYNPTGGGDRNSIFLDMDIGIPSIMGNVDLDWALTLAGYGAYKFPVINEYAIGKRLWNLKRGKSLNYQYANDAEKKSIIMAEEMLNGKNFYEFFPIGFVLRAFNPKDPINKTIQMKVLVSTYGSNY